MVGKNESERTIFSGSFTGMVEDSHCEGFLYLLYPGVGLHGYTLLSLVSIARQISRPRH